MLERFKTPWPVTIGKREYEIHDDRSAAAAYAGYVGYIVKVRDDDRWIEIGKGYGGPGPDLLAIHSSMWEDLSEGPNAFFKVADFIAAAG
jgi:hypothetical protein